LYVDAMSSNGAKLRILHYIISSVYIKGVVFGRIGVFELGFWKIE